MRKTITFWGILLMAVCSASAQRVELDAARWKDTEHNFRGENYMAAPNVNEAWVNTLPGLPSWFCYDLSLENADSSLPLYLACTFNNVDYKDGFRLSTQVYMNDVLVSGVYRPAQWKDGRSVVHILVPAEVWRDADGVKEKVTVRVENPEGGYSMGFCGVALVQNAGNKFRCEDWTSGDLVRLPLEDITYDTENNRLSVSCRGTVNDVAFCMKREAEDKYIATPGQKYLVVCGTSLDTSEPWKSHLWWLNGHNRNSSETPLKQMTTSAGVSYIVWDVTRTGIAGNMVGNPRTLTSFGSGNNTLFGLTSSAPDGKSAVITDIAFYSLTEIREKYPELAEAMQIAFLDEVAETHAEFPAESHPVAVRRVMNPMVWNTFCMPFNMDAGQLAENGITEVKKLSRARLSGDMTVVSFEKENHVEAGVPYIVKVAETVREVNMDAAAGVQADPLTLEVDGVAMKGNYGKMIINENQFFISNSKFYMADCDVTVKGFRAYLELPQAVEAGVNTLSIDIDGEATGMHCIDRVATDGVTVDVYTLSGVCLKRGVPAADALDGLSKGVYVVNGMKVIKF